MAREVRESTPLKIVLVEPQIPPNTGNVARLCAATGCQLILLGELGFELNDSSLKRAGLDYWKYVKWQHLPDREGFFANLKEKSFHLLTTHSSNPYTRIESSWGDYLIFGKETAGLPKSLLEQHQEQCYTIPIFEEGVRSLNLASAVAIVLYDALNRMQPFQSPS